MRGIYELEVWELNNLLVKAMARGAHATVSAVQREVARRVRAQESAERLRIPA